MMKKPLVLIIFGGLMLGSIGAGAYVYFFKSSRISKPPDSTGAMVTPTAAPQLLTWDDPAGFTMQYPEGLTVNKHDEDLVNYAHVELTDNAHPGNVIIWVKDIPSGVTDTASWGKKVSAPASAISFDTSLAGQSAQKILVSSPEKVVSVGVIYDGVLWYIEAKLTDEPYWQSVFDGVIQSFTFKPTASQAAGGTANSGSVNDSAVDEEEVLE